MPFWWLARPPRRAARPCWMRARTSSPSRPAWSMSTTARPGSRRSRYCCSPSEKTMASKCPVWSESVRMPILLPVLVRRSCRSSTVAATRPTESPPFTARQNSTQVCTRSFSSTGRRIRRADGRTGRSRRRRIPAAAARRRARARRAGCAAARRPRRRRRTCRPCRRRRPRAIAGRAPSWRRRRRRRVARSGSSSSSAPAAIEALQRALVERAAD